MSKERIRAFATATVCSLAAALLLCFIAYNIAISIPSPVKYNDFEGVSVDYTDDVFSLTVQSKAGGLYCSGFTTSIDDGILYLTVNGVPLSNGDEAFTASFKVPDDIRQIKYRYKHDETTLRTLKFNDTED